MATENLVTQSIIDRLNAIPRSEFDTVGFQEGGKDYSMDPNGLISVRDVGAKPTDQVQVFDQTGNFLSSHAVEQRSDFVQAINQAGRVGIPAIIGASLLGPAGFGLLNAPAAAAVGSGGSTLFQGGSIEDALKAAALAGLTAYGFDSLFTPPELAQARELAASGLSEDAIIDTLLQQGVGRNAAIEAASNATGLPAIGANRGLEFASTGAAPDVLVTGAPAAGPGLLSSAVSAAPAVIPALVSNTATQQATQPTEQNTNQNQVVVTAPTAPPTTSIGNIIPGIVPAVVPPPVPAPAPTPAPAPAPATEQVEVVEKKQPTPTTTPVVLPPAPPPVANPPVEPVEQVEVVDKRNKPPITPLGPAVLAPLPGIPPEVLTELPKPAQPPENKSLFTPSDILKLIGLLGGIGAGSALSNTGTGSVSVPPSDPRLGTTTPQFGPDYYAAVQQYYNAYMPQTPRNVATPLQQWYENKFGA